MGCHALLQGLFPTQESNLGLLHCRQILYHLSHHGSPCKFVGWSLFNQNIQVYNTIQLREFIQKRMTNHLENWWMIFKDSSGSKSLISYLSTEQGLLFYGLPWWLRRWRIQSACNVGGPRVNCWVWKMPWRREWQPTPVFLPGKSHGQKNLVVYSPWGHKRSDMTLWLTLFIVLYLFLHFQLCIMHTKFSIITNPLLWESFS